MFPSREEYEHFIYSLPEKHTSILYSALVVVPRSPTVATVRGELGFQGDLRLFIIEVVDFSQQRIVDYSYEVRRGDDKLHWYDCWPHPHIPSLQTSHPHHKHIPPDIKNNRIAAPQISFDHPNLPFLIGEIENPMHVSDVVS